MSPARLRAVVVLGLIVLASLAALEPHLLTHQVVRTTTLRLSPAGRADGVVAAGQQSWMQYAPELATECGFGEPTLTEQLINWLGAKWPAMFMVTGACTNKEWVFLGLSLANWSAVCFVILAVYCGWLLRRRKTAR